MSESESENSGSFSNTDSEESLEAPEQKDEAYSNNLQQSEELNSNNASARESTSASNPSSRSPSSTLAELDSAQIPAVEPEFASDEASENKDATSDSVIASITETSINPQENDDSDDGYNPEAMYGDETDKQESAQPIAQDSQNLQETQSLNEAQSDSESDTEENKLEDTKEESDDEYDPEGLSAPPNPDGSPESASVSFSLPAKPPVVAQAPVEGNQSLEQAYKAIMNSDLVKDPAFQKLPKNEQMQMMLEQLAKKNVNLIGTDKVNFDQVYSYNKPFKNVKNPIPLIPVNARCKRPNITLPISQSELEAYGEFVDREAYYTELGQWDQFPDGSRMFIGNLPANTITKQDLFRIFNAYGEVIQISIKAGYGFAQFRTAEQCADAITGETNVPLHNKIMHLEASRPQKNKPLHAQNVTQAPTARDRNKFNKNSGNDANLPPNPRINNQRRNRSRSPRRDGRRGNRQRSPKRKRGGPNVPECQVYSTDRSSAYFVRQVVKGFSASRIETELSDASNHDIKSLISDAAYSGVMGVCIVNDRDVDIQVFEHTPDGGVKFDEYLGIEPKIAVDLLIRAKKNKNPSFDTNFSPNPVQAQQYQPPVNENYYQSSNQKLGSHYQPTYQQPPPPNNSQQQQQYYGSPAQKDPSQLQTNLLQTLQNMDPAAMQNMLALLQQQKQNIPPMYQNEQPNFQHQQPMYQAQPNIYQNQQPVYTPHQPMAPPPQPQQQPQSNAMLSNLLSQLQQTQSGPQPSLVQQSPYSSNPYQPQQQPQNSPPQQQQKPSTSSAFNLMDTLARLGGNH